MKTDEEYEAIHDEELDAFRMPFEDYLADVHAAEVSCTENDCLDDDAPDSFDAWYEGLDVEDLARYAEEYGKKCFKRGREIGR